MAAGPAPVRSMGMDAGCCRPTRCMCADSPWLEATMGSRGEWARRWSWQLLSSKARSRAALEAYPRACRLYQASPEAGAPPGGRCRPCQPPWHLKKCWGGEIAERVMRTNDIIINIITLSPPDSYWVEGSHSGGSHCGPRGKPERRMRVPEREAAGPACEAESDRARRGRWGGGEARLPPQVPGARCLWGEGEEARLERGLPSPCGLLGRTPCGEA